MITGANTGIGFETARCLAGSGATVVLVCRNRARGEAAVAAIKATGKEDVQLLLCDLSSQAAIRRAVEEFCSRVDRLHVLINNAAIYTSERVVTEDGIEMQFAVNYLAPFLLTNLLMDTLEASAPARIINVSTVNHFDVVLDLHDLQSAQVYEPKIVHMRSKLAVILFTYELARRLQNSGVTTNSLHPGVIGTNLLGAVRNVPPDQRTAEQMGVASLEVGARTPLFLAMSPQVDGISGKYFDDCKVVQSSDETYNKKKARRLWEISETLTGIVKDSA